MIERVSSGTQIWQQILQPSEASYQDHLDNLLAIISDFVGLPACFLYLRDGNNLHLERVWWTPSMMKDEWITLESLEAASLNGGVDHQTPYSEFDQIVRTAMGFFYSLPLHLNQTFVGLLQVGPLSSEGLSRQLKRKIKNLCFPVSLALQQAQQKETFKKKLTAATVCSKVMRRLQGSPLELDRFIHLLLGLALNATQTEAGFVAMTDPMTGQLTLRTSIDLPPEFIAQINLDPEVGLFSWTGTENSDEDTLGVRDIDFLARFNIYSILAVPLLKNRDPLGLFVLINFKSAEIFSHHNLNLLKTFARQIELMVHNRDLFECFTEQYVETIKGLAASLDARWLHTKNHHQQVAQAGRLIAQEMTLSSDEIEAIYTAGLVHDVGMAGVVELEGGDLVDFEHPTIGARMLDSFPLPLTVIEAVATHHEWFDGWGFPQGLAGEAIALGGRILAIAEFIIEMAQGAPFSPPWSRLRLIDELKQRHGIQFDPKITDITLALLGEQKLQI